LLTFKNLEDYAIEKPEPEKKHRKKYTDEEDHSIMQYVNKSSDSPKGAKLWKKMVNENCTIRNLTIFFKEKEGVTSHPWQSMKDRYNKTLSKRAKEARKEFVEKRLSAQDEDLESDEDNRKEVDEEEEELVEKSKGEEAKYKNEDINRVIINRIKRSVSELEESTSLPKNVIYHALLVTSGSITLAHKYLSRTLTKEDPLPWQFAEDKVIIENQSVESLLSKRSRGHIDKRIKFLESGLEQ
jgi:hypothetical protein